MLPTVGRTVHFHEDLAEEPQAAIVTAVCGSDVNLVVFPPSGGLLFKQDVPYGNAHEFEGWLPENYWTWPPRA